MSGDLVTSGNTWWICAHLGESYATGKPLDSFTERNNVSCFFVRNISGTKAVSAGGKRPVACHRTPNVVAVEGAETGHPSRKRPEEEPKPRREKNGKVVRRSDDPRQKQNQKKAVRVPLEPCPDERIPPRT